MDSISSILHELNVSDLTPQDCRLILDSISTDSLVGITPPAAGTNALNSAINFIQGWRQGRSKDKAKGKNKNQIRVDSSNEIDIQRIAASALCTLSSAHDPNVRLTAIQLLLAVCSLPGASAFAVCNTNVVSSIGACMVKICHEQIRIPSKNVNNGEISSIRPSKRSRDDMKGRNNENEELQEDVQESEVVSEEDNMFGKAASGNQNERDGIVVKVEAAFMRSCLRAIMNNLDLFWKRSEEYPMECLADALCGMACLCIVRASETPAFKDVAELAADCMAALAGVSQQAMLLVFKSVGPALTTIGRDSKFPASFKGRSKCHDIAVYFLKSLTCKCDEFSDVFEANKLLPIPHTPGGTRSYEHESKTPSSTKSQGGTSTFVGKSLKTPKSTSSSRSATPPSSPSRGFTVPYSCVIGAIQRMTLAMQAATAPVRSLVLPSIKDTLLILHQQKDGNRAIDQYFSFLAKLSRSTNINLRAYSLEIASGIAMDEWAWNIEESVDLIGPRAMIEIVLTRCDDVSPIVRLRAISAIFELLFTVQNDSSPTPLASVLLQFAIGDKLRTMKSPSSSSAPAPNTPVSAERLAKSPCAPKTFNKSVSIIDILRVRVYDEKPMVRAKAVQTFGLALTMKWPKYQPSSGKVELITMLVQDEDMTALIDGCLDIAVSVRKQAMNGLTEIIQSRPTISSLIDAWLVGVLPLSADPETSVQIKNSQATFDLLFKGILSWSDSKQAAAPSYLWALCDQISTSPVRTKLLKSSVTIMIKQGILGGNNCKRIMHSIKKACCFLVDKSQTCDNGVSPSSISTTGWLLLESIMSQALPTSIMNDVTHHLVSGGRKGSDPASSTDFVVSCWLQRSHKNTDELSDQDIRIVNVIEKLGSSISFENKDRICKDLLKIVSAFRAQPAAQTAIVNALYALTTAGANGASARSLVNRWATPLLQSAYTTLYMHVWGVSPVPYDDQEQINFCKKASKKIDRICSLLFLLGELSMIGFSVEEDEDRGKMNREGNNEMIKINISPDIINIVKVLMAKDYPVTAVPVFEDCGQSMSLDAIPSKLRAHSFVTFGKFCLRSKSLARDHVNVYLRELHSASTHSHTIDQCEKENVNSVKSNALLVLGDLCVRYTNLVDRHIGSLACCLQDKDALVRKHALILLTQLLLQDFLKWRGMLLFRFIATSTDCNTEIAEIARNILTKTLVTKFPSDFYCQHFAESVLVFNECVDHPLYTAMASSGIDGDSGVDMNGVNLVGPTNRNKRLKIYSFMMETFNEEQKIQATAKLTHEILSHAIESSDSTKANLQMTTSSETSSLSPFESAVHDTLLILQSPMLKVGKTSNVLKEEEENVVLEDENAKKSAAVAVARTKVLNKLSKQHMVDQVLPVLCSLKHTLEKTRSILQRPLTEYLMHLMKNNKAEVDYILSADPALKAEIEYDMKMFLRDTKAKEVAQSKAIQDINDADSNVRIDGGSAHRSDGRSVDSGKRRLSLNFNRLSLVDSRRRKSRGQLNNPTIVSEDIVMPTTNRKVSFGGVLSTSLPDLVDRFQTSSSEIPFSPSVERRWSVAVDNMDDGGAVDVNTASKKCQNAVFNAEVELSHKSPEKKRSKRSQRSAASSMNSLFNGSSLESENNGSLMNIALQSSDEKIGSHEDASKTIHDAIISKPIAYTGGRGKRGAFSVSTLLNLSEP